MRKFKEGAAEFDYGIKDPARQLKKMDMPSKRKAQNPVRQTGKYGDNAMVENTAEFDYGTADPTLKQHPYQVPSKHKAQNPVRNTGRWGDNAMVEEGDESQLEKLRTIINNAGVDDDEIMGGVRFTPKGYQKIAAKLGIAADDVPTLIASLISKLRRERKADDNAMMNEDADPRFTYEKDFLGNVTIRDAQEGTEHYVEGSQASELLAELSAQPDNEQNILGQFAQQMHAPNVTESVMEAEAGPDNFARVAATLKKLHLPFTFTGVHNAGDDKNFRQIDVKFNKKFHEATRVAKDIARDLNVHLNVESNLETMHGATLIADMIDRETRESVGVISAHQSVLDPAGPRGSYLVISVWVDGVHEALEEDSEDYEDEITSSGTFNFPWKVNGARGTGTASYAGNAEKPVIRVVSVRDMQGEEMKPNHEMLAAIKQQAIDFIPNA